MTKRDSIEYLSRRDNAHVQDIDPVYKICNPFLFLCLFYNIKKIGFGLWDHILFRNYGCVGILRNFPLA